MTKAIDDVLAERKRQIEVEGFDDAHDDTWPTGHLIRAASSYCYSADTGQTNEPPIWPWASSWWKPSGPRRDMVKAAALLIAAIERHDREMGN